MTTGRTRWVQLALAVCCVVAFAPGLTSPLTHYDDPLYLTSNKQLTVPGWEGFAELWDATRAYRGDALEFFPLRDSVYWVLFQLYGPIGTPYHLASLLLHVLSTLLVLRLLLDLEVSGWAAVTAAALFAVHPIHIESVTWAAGLKDPMYTALMLGSIVAWLAWRRTSRFGLYLLALLLLVASLLTKSLAIVTPLLLLAVDRLAPGGSTAWRKLLPPLAAPALVCGLFLVQYLLIGKANRVLVEPHGGSLLSHVVLSAWAQVMYSRQAFAPTSFRLIYCFAPVEGLTDARLLGALALLGLLLFTLWRWRTQPLRLLCVGWYFACLLPVSNLVPFPAIMADRYLYAASVGACLLVALLLEDAVPRLKTLLAVAMTLTLLLVTAARTALWRDEENLWADADEDPECLVDPDFGAAQVHLLRFKTTRDREVAMASLERLYETPAVRNGHFGTFCDSLVRGARMALRAGDLARAAHWARNAVLACPGEAWVWNASMEVNLHRDPALASLAAERAWRLEPGPLTALLRGLTALEVRLDPVAAGGVLEAVRAAPEVTCPALADWMRAVSPPLQQAVSEASASCSRR